jgi:hypothetical protein
MYKPDVIYGIFTEFQQNLVTASNTFARVLKTGEAGRLLWNDQHPDEAFSVEDFEALNKLFRHLGV